MTSILNPAPGAHANWSYNIGSTTQLDQSKETAGYKRV